jgi:hypothetical protein
MLIWSYLVLLLQFPKKKNFNTLCWTQLSRCLSLFTWGRKYIQFPKHCVFRYLEVREMDTFQNASYSEGKKNHPTTPNRDFIKFILLLSSHLCLSFRILVSFLLGFPPKSYTHSSLLYCVLHWGEDECKMDSGLLSFGFLNHSTNKFVFPVKRI